jgi:hypothetical protein
MWPKRFPKLPLLDEFSRVNLHPVALSARCFKRIGNAAEQYQQLGHLKAGHLRRIPDARL